MVLRVFSCNPISFYLVEQPMDRFRGIYRIESIRLYGLPRACRGVGTTHHQDGILLPFAQKTGWNVLARLSRGPPRACRGGEMQCNDVGEIAYRMFKDIPNHHKNITLDEFIIMPNHIHGIIVLCGNHGGSLNGRDGGWVNHRDVASNISPGNSIHMSTISPKSGSLGSVVRSFKSAVTNWCHGNGHPNFAWQSLFHDHIIRDDHSLHRIRKYIIENPMKWYLDGF